MSKVRFNLRSNKTKEHSIQMIYRIKDVGKLVIGTGIHIPQKYWNPQSMRARENVDFLDYYQINALLDRWEATVKDAIYKFTHQRQIPSKSQLKKAIFKSIHGESESTLEESVTDYFKNFISQKSKAGATLDTIKVYQNVLNHFVRFRQKKLFGRSLKFKDLDKALWLDFRKYLQETLDTNTVHKVIKKLRTIMNDAVGSGYEVCLDYKHRDIQVSYVKQPKIYLNETEIKLVEDLVLKPHSHLDRVRDRFLIGLRTGLRFADLMRLDMSFITERNGNKIIQIRLNKSKNFVLIPIHPKVKAILEKHGGYPPVMSMQKFNDSLKVLCKKAGINSNVSKVVRGKQKVFIKSTLVSSHICRRSFATNGYKAEVPPILLQRIVGHSSMKQFMEYICINEEDSLEMIFDHAFFKC